MGNQDETSHFVATPIDAIEPAVAAVRAFFATGATKPLEWRKKQLRGLYQMLADHKDAITDACAKDFGKPYFEANFAEVSLNMNHIVYCLEHLAEWAKPDFPEKGKADLGNSLSVVKEPFGVCLVIAPFNYPFDLILKPLTVAIAAGNVCVLKPSEMTPHCAMLMTDLVPKYIDPSAVTFVNGGVKETTVLLEQKFDHILYTGNGTVGRIVMSAAAKHLTPVILELGGKSPVFVDPALSPSDMEVVAKRVAWGKFSNCGQTCIAPDYAMVPSHLVEPFVNAMSKAITDFYGPDPSTSASFARIINPQHTKRVGSLIDEERTVGSRIVCGGKWDAEKCYVAPTVVVTTFQGALMKGEVFGPVLPVVPVDTVHAMMAHVNAGDRPLALYPFSNNAALAEKIHMTCISGGVTINDVMFHGASDSAPFGGVGASGMGYHHGKYGFDLYSHKKTVYGKALSSLADKLETWVGRYPPYTREGADFMVGMAARKLPSENRGLLRMVVAGVIGAALYAGFRARK